MTATQWRGLQQTALPTCANPLTTWATGLKMSNMWWRLRLASGAHLDLGRAPYVLYGVKYIDLVSLAPFSGQMVQTTKEEDGTVPLCFAVASTASINFIMLYGLYLCFSININGPVSNRKYYGVHFFYNPNLPYKVHLWSTLYFMNGRRYGQNH